MTSEVTNNTAYSKPLNGKTIDFAGENHAPANPVYAAPAGPTLAEILQTARVMVNDLYPVPPKALSIVCGEETFTFGTLGNFSLATGKAKSKKTFLMLMFLAACLGLTTIQGVIKSELPEGKPRIIWIDTEQSKYHVWKKLQALAVLCGVVDMANIEVYCLREFPPAMRAELTEYLLIAGNPDKTIGLVVIDGVRDYISDINAPAEATEIATKLMRWTTLAWCHIITVLHQNKGDNNARGHVGTELINKAETVINIIVSKEDKNISTVETEMTRDKDFPAFAFKINDLGMPEILQDYCSEMAAEGEKRKPFDPYSINEDTHRDVLRKIYQSNTEYKRDPLLAELSTGMAAFGFKVGLNKAKELLAYYSQRGWLRNAGDIGKPAKWCYTPYPV